MIFNSYKWYLGKNDSKIFIEKVVGDKRDIQLDYLKFKGNEILVSLDFVCNYILSNNISYKKIEEMISPQGSTPIKGYPWVSFFSKLQF